MKGKRLLKALGQVDADYIEEASPTQQAKRPGWLKWGAIAACLVLVCAAIAHFSPANQDEDKQGVADAAPMVYVNDTPNSTVIATNIFLVSTFAGIRTNQKWNG